MYKWMFTPETLFLWPTPLERSQIHVCAKLAMDKFGVGRKKLHCVLARSPPDPTGFDSAAAAAAQIHKS
jgi:hypothetical protein